MKPDWWPQPYPPDGTVTSDGIRKQLGTPTMDPLVVLLRESAQNSWDARTAEHGPIRLEYRFRTVSGTHAESFRELLLPGPFEAFTTEAERETLCVVTVSDRGTTGLGGPLRSDQAPLPDESPDFVNLIRNVGEPRDRDLGGGTYGFGKGSLFRVSRAGALLVDTRAWFRGSLQRRLMGTALGPTYEEAGKRYTGRHWWGTLADDVIDPLIDADADHPARALGLGDFEDDATGTDIHILFFETGQDDDGYGRSIEGAARLLAGSAAWFLWPKLVERDGRRSIDLTVTVDGTPIPVPDPARARRIRPFVRALERIDKGEGEQHRRTTRPPHHVGDFAFVKEVVGAVQDEIVDLAAPFTGPAHHCARMRRVELVVDYFGGAPLPDPDLQYGAVFRASDDADAHFATAEPPTHDAWVHKHLHDVDLGVVRGAQSFVRNRLAARVDAGTTSGSGSKVPLGKLSSALARILPGADGDGADDPQSGGSDGSTGGGSAQPFTVGSARLEVSDGEARVVQTVTVRPRPDRLRLRAEAHIVVDGGRERATPAGGATPTVLGWRSESGRIRLGDVLNLEPDHERTWEVVVRPAPLTSTTIGIRHEPEDRP